MRRSLILLAVFGLVAAACSTGASNDPAPAQPAVDQEDAEQDGGAEEAANVTVHILKDAYTVNEDPADDFDPDELRVEVGTTVTWVNDDIVWHTATGHGSFDTGQIDPGQSASVTFTEPGVYEYHCHPHPWMEGKVIVGDVEDMPDGEMDGHDDGHEHGTEHDGDGDDHDHEHREP